MRALLALLVLVALATLARAEPVKSLPPSMELVDVQAITISNLKLQSVGDRDKALQAEKAQLLGERQKLIDRLAAKYQMVITGNDDGDEVDPVSLKILRKPRPPKPTSPPKPAPKRPAK
jgi:hypothetical protein